MCIFFPKNSFFYLFRNLFVVKQNYSFKFFLGVTVTFTIEYVSQIVYGTSFLNLDSFVFAHTAVLLMKLSFLTHNLKAMLKNPNTCKYASDIVFANVKLASNRGYFTNNTFFFSFKIKKISKFLKNKSKVVCDGFMSFD